VLYKLFVVEVCKNTSYGRIYLTRREKKMFIPLPWKIGEIIVKNISHMDELANHFDNFKLK
jgi:hypothetical protein